MTLKSFVKGNIEGNHIVIISQEEGYDIWLNAQQMNT